ncbi:alpha/beta hydrolase fold protein [Aspergillus steynii IBT 23096]|uniref:Alpha/beta hydrolase fold protein n=1 Tax=Aspergillus steynii IBT 23096 TaxID=1392250 RepID=A0A2I2FXG9_9EURO|nr:alpha/beta hydrolase fold protein [Aspergillus steynii IBT 23096]PLB45302.1 alpha/beta hydrolase fold protein [Aspergillus steynii IBT 23096]
MVPIARLNLIRQHLLLHPSLPFFSPSATSSSATIMATGTADYPEPLPKVGMPFLHRLNCFLRLWLLKLLANTYFFILRLVFPPSPGSQPTLVKRYACRAMLETRIFYPRDYRAGEKLLPVYFNVHGGGFALCDASVDDEFCSSWASRTGMLVISLDYRKVPLHPFPTATYDVAAQVEAILDDESLPIDRARVAIGGFSAGGNLALSVAQLPPLKELVQAAVVYYPIVDFGHPPNEKLASRPYTSGPKDNLEEASWWLDWGYVRVGQNRRDPLLSPEYARQEDLPPWIYMIGAQWDMLRLESQVMIHRLAGLEDKEDQEAPFEKGTYKWTLATGQSHGFTHSRGRNPAKRAKRQQMCEEIYGEAHAWLKKSVLR